MLLVSLLKILIYEHVWREVDGVSIVEVAFVTSSDHCLPICITSIIYCHHSCCSVTLSIKETSIEVNGLREPLASALYTLICPIRFHWIRISSLPRLLALNSAIELCSLLLLLMYFFKRSEGSWDEISRVGLAEKHSDISTIIACLSAKSSDSICKLDFTRTFRMVHSLKQKDYLNSKKQN